MTEQGLRALLVDYSRRLHARGWVANHDGNLSVRLGAGRFLCTPGATSKAEVTADGLVVVDEGGQRVSGKGKPFSEMALHLCVYAARKDALAVVHAHPVSATAFGAAGCAPPAPFLPEAVVSLGPTLPLVPLTAPGPAAVQALQPYATAADAVLLAGNGVLAWGDDLEQAYLRVELVEHLCRIALLAQPLGGVRPLPVGLMPPLLEARRKAGLGPQARGYAAPAVMSAPAGAPGGAGASGGAGAPGGAGASGGAGDLAGLIRQELEAVLRGH